MDYNTILNFETAAIAKLILHILYDEFDSKFLKQNFNLGEEYIEYLI